MNLYLENTGKGILITFLLLIGQCFMPKTIVK